MCYNTIIRPVTRRLQKVSEIYDTDAINYDGENQMLTQSRLKELFSYDPETGLFTRISCDKRSDYIGKIAGHKNKRGYIKIKISQKAYAAHRLAWLYIYGEFPKGEIDHINRVKDDNRICNLRDVPTIVNGLNKGLDKNNKSGVKGVMLYKPNNKWLACIGYHGKYHHLGYFDKKEDAIKARKKAEKILHDPVKGAYDGKSTI